jgi:carboxymethylenebutenolidase
MPTIQTTTVEISARDGSFPAYRAVPAATPASAVVLIAPIFGVTASMREVADRYAEHGFIALAPDPFWRQHPGPLGREDRELASSRGKAVADSDVLDDLARCVASLRAMPECNGTVAVAGFCFGGKYAFLAAARGLVDAAAAFHGSRVGTVLDEAPNVRVPLSLHWGDNDHAAPLEEIRAVETALAGKPEIEIGVYPGIGHGFTQTDNPNYDAPATAASEARVFAMLARLRAAERLA